MDRELFYEIVLFAEKRGYKDHLAMLPVMPLCETSATLLEKKIFWQRWYEIIFNHDFGKAIWGEELSVLKNEQFCDCYYPYYIWKEHLQHLVLLKLPFEYLEKEYKRIKS